MSGILGMAFSTLSGPTLTTTTWTDGAANGVWDDAANWDAGVPTASLNAVLTGSSAINTSIVQMFTKGLDASAYTGLLDMSAELDASGDVTFSAGMTFVAQSSLVMLNGNLAMGGQTIAALTFGFYGDGNMGLSADAQAVACSANMDTLALGAYTLALSGSFELYGGVMTQTSGKLQLTVVDGGQTQLIIHTPDGADASAIDVEFVNTDTPVTPTYFVLGSFDITLKSLTVLQTGITNVTTSTAQTITITGGLFIDGGSIDLVGSAINVGGYAVAHNCTISNCDFSGGATLDAVDNCVDGGGNTNVAFTALAYATWDNGIPGPTYSNGDLTAVTTAFYPGVRATFGRSSGRWVWSVTPGSQDTVIGIVSALWPYAMCPGGNYPGSSNCGGMGGAVGYYGYGTLFINPDGNQTGLATYTTQEIVVYLNLDLGTYQFYKGQVAQDIERALPGWTPGATYYPSAGFDGTAGTADFGASGLSADATAVANLRGANHGWYTVSNVYAEWEPPFNLAPTYSTDRLTVSAMATGGVRSTVGRSSGIWCFAGAPSSSQTQIGLGSPTFDNAARPGSASNGGAALSYDFVDKTIEVYPGSDPFPNVTFTLPGDIIIYVVDLDSGTYDIYQNNVAGLLPGGPYALPDWVSGQPWWIAAGAIGSGSMVLYSGGPGWPAGAAAVATAAGANQGWFIGA